MRRLPPLNALKTFECAARHGGMQSAAVELCVTPAAVRQQVRSLERYLGLPLFRRVRGGLALPHEGEVYLREARVALDRLASATEQLMEKRVAGTLRVSVIPSFCSHWLVPRLSAFVELYPEVVLRLIEDIRTVDFSRDRVDMALRYGRGGAMRGFAPTVSWTSACTSLPLRCSWPAPVWSGRAIWPECRSCTRPTSA